MRDVIFAALAAGALAVLGAQPAQAVGTRHPFCLQGNEYPALSYCVFDNYGQCMATASGRFLTCIANPYYAGATDAMIPTPIATAIADFGLTIINRTERRESHTSPRKD